MPRSSMFQDREATMEKVAARFTPSRTFIGVAAIVVCLVALWAAGNIWEHLDAGEIMVVQSPVSGTLTWSKDPGLKWQGFGKVTKYKKRFQFWFSASKDQGKTNDESIMIRFNDKGQAHISGSIAVEMPLDDKHLTLIHTQYGSQEAVEQQLIRTVVEKSVYMTGPLMSSQESAAERRNELLQFIEDQIGNGIYLTETTQEKQPDPITGQPKTVSVVKIVRDSIAVNGLKRTDISPLSTFGIKTFNPSINGIQYDKTVEDQIQDQQKATMAVQTAMAMSKKAEQDAITAEKNGQALAAAAKWEQEVIKAKEVTAAEQRKDVATLDLQTADLKKKAEILSGEGEATKRQLIMNADGALDKKLAAYVEVQKVYADAIKGYQGNWVPTVVSGSGGQQAAGSGAMQMMEMLGSKAALDLGLSLQASGAGKTNKKQ